MASSGEQTGTEIPIDIARLPVGGALRARREQLGWGLAEVAAWLRIKLAYLEALEGGQVSKLPGTAYAMGFLRAYASALGLDADDMARRFRSETKDTVRKPELSFPVPVPERGVPAGAIVLLGVVMVVVAYAGWYELGGRLTHEAHTVPPVPDALAPYAATSGRGTSPQVATVMPGPGQTPSPLPPSTTEAKPADQPAPRPAGSTPETAGVAAEMTRPPTVAMTAPSSPAPAAATGAVTTVPSTTPPITQVGGAGIASAPQGGAAPATTSATQPPPASLSPPATPGQVTLNAVTTCWVQVRQVSGKVIYDHVLQAGEHWSVPADAGDVVLSTGNAGGLTVSADGVTSPALGRVGGVRRGIPLSAEAVRNGTIAAPAPSADAVKPSATSAAAPATSTATSPSPTAAPAPAPVPSGSPVGTGVQTIRPHPVTHRAAPPQGEDETDRLNRAQLKQTAPPQ